MFLLEGVLFQRPCAGLGPRVCEFGGPGLGDLPTLAEDHASSELQPLEQIGSRSLDIGLLKRREINVNKYHF